MQIKTSMASSKWQMARSDDDFVGFILGAVGTIFVVIVGDGGSEGEGGGGDSGGDGGGEGGGGDGGGKGESATQQLGLQRSARPFVLHPA